MKLALFIPCYVYPVAKLFKNGILSKIFTIFSYIKPFQQGNNQKSWQKQN